MCYLALFTNLCQTGINCCSCRTRWMMCIKNFLSLQIVFLTCNIFPFLFFSFLLLLLLFYFYFYFFTGEEGKREGWRVRWLILLWFRFPFPSIFCFLLFIFSLFIFSFIYFSLFSFSFFFLLQHYYNELYHSYILF